MDETAHEQFPETRERDPGYGHGHCPFPQSRPGLEAHPRAFGVRERMYGQVSKIYLGRPPLFKTTHHEKHTSSDKKGKYADVCKIDVSKEVQRYGKADTPYHGDETRPWRDPFRKYANEIDCHNNAEYIGVEVLDESHDRIRFANDRDEGERKEYGQDLRDTHHLFQLIRRIAAQCGCD